MAISLTTPDVDDLAGVVEVLRGWQADGLPMQLHPGDLGWFMRFGAAATAAATRLWQQDGKIQGIGLLDGVALVRLTLAPDAWSDQSLAQKMADDLTDPGQGLLPTGEGSVEAPAGAPLLARLSAAGWHPAEPWTPLRRGLAEPVPEPGIRVETVGPENAHRYADVLRAAFDKSSFTESRWHAMAAEPAYRNARSLLGYDGRGNPVAVATVWSAGPGKPGLLEPMGVSADFRGQGHGRAITLAAAAALRELGASSALVCTPSSNSGGVATYAAAGFQELPQRSDWTRGPRRDPK
ncbi:MAG: GNAT family N-acetyltransferase [Renibacterium sp.]|nr:GNAT family N-acetyltransferase [Renibacterium sp.]